MAWVRYGPANPRNKAALVAGCLCFASAAHGEVEILALGDSLTQGYGLMVEDGFVPQLQAWLHERGHDVRILNGGVSGDTTAGGLSRVAWSLTPEVDAMIVALGGNDMLRGLDPEAVRSNLDGIMQVAAAQDIEVLLVGMQAPGNYGPAYKEDFDSIYPDLAEAYDALLFDSFFKGLDANDLSDATAYMQSDGIHPNADGVARIVSAIGPAVEDLIAQSLD